MGMMSNLEKAAGVIQRIQYINVASVTEEGLPWNTPVYCAFDKELNFYWLSWKENQHSKNIHNNPNVFVTIYDSTVPEGTGFGVYLQGRARAVTGLKDLAKAVVYGYKRRGAAVRDIVYFLGKYPRRVYKFTPEKVWVNGDSKKEGQFIDIKEEISLDELGKHIKL